MKRFLISIFIFLASLHGNELLLPTFSPEGESFPIVNLEGTPNATIDGSVNVISGDFSDFERDLVMIGSLPLTIERSYSSGDTSKGGLSDGWHLLPGDAKH